MDCEFAALEESHESLVSEFLGSGLGRRESEYYGVA